MSDKTQDGAIIYCEGAFNTPNGKTAHGLVRFTRRYRVLAVIDSRYGGADAGRVLDGRENQIPVVASLNEACQMKRDSATTASHFVIGLAPDGGRLNDEARKTVKEAIKLGLHIDCGLHDFLSEDEEISALAAAQGVTIRDIRKPPARKDLHFFSGKIEQVTSLKVAVLGSDSAIGKRTTAWQLVRALLEKGIKTEMIGTGQTAWMQGVNYGILLDSIVNDFLTGEIEHVVWRAWHETSAEVLVIEGQGGLLNPAYPGGYEIIAAARPDALILQHAPTRKTYDGFPQYPIQPLPQQVEALQIISGRPVIAITLNHENLEPGEINFYTDVIEKTMGIPTFDVLMDGGDALAALVGQILKTNRDKK